MDDIDESELDAELECLGDELDELDEIGEMDGDADATPSYLAEAADAAELPAVPSGKVEGDVAVDEFGLPAAPAAAT